MNCAGSFAGVFFINGNGMMMIVKGGAHMSVTAKWAFGGGIVWKKRYSSKEELLEDLQVLLEPAAFGNSSFVVEISC